jgi:hypothetical protein
MLDARLILPSERAEAKNLKNLSPQRMNYLTLNFIVINGAFPNL